MKYNNYNYLNKKLILKLKTYFLNKLIFKIMEIVPFTSLEDALK
jgi:hypothetical protein